MQKTKQKVKEIGKIRLKEDQQLIINLIDDEKLDIRVWLNSEKYSGPTKRGVQFYLFDGIRDKFKKMVEKVDKEYQELV